MDIERVRLNVTLKAGKKIWLEGEILHSPLPLEIHGEILRDTGTVRVLSSSEPSTKIINTVIAVPKFKDASGNRPTTATSFERKEVEAKPKRVKRARIND